MAHAVRMPKPGQATEECTVVSWRVAEGDPVRRGDVLFEIETDKANMDVEAFDDGILLRRLVDEGATVPVNTVCAWIGEPGEVIPAGDEAVAAGQGAARAVAAGQGAPGVVAARRVALEAVDAGPFPVVDATTSDVGPARSRISPRASRLAAEAGIDPRTIVGTGPDGRVVERDVQAAVEALATAGGLDSLGGLGGPARRDGRGERDDHRFTEASDRRTIGPSASTSAPAPQVPDEDEPRPLSRMRRAIADRLTHSWQTIPTFSVTVPVDVTRLLALRSELRAVGTTLTVTDFVASAVAQTLAEFADVNSRTDGISVWHRRRVHLGIAVSVPTGLVVPVIRDADRLMLEEIHEQATSLATRARAGALGPDDLSGSTFTVSNLGMLGVEQFTAIVNPGESAILAVSAALPTAAILGDGIAIRSIMKLTLTADHRLVDGEMGARFLGAIRRRLEDAEAIRTMLANG